MIMRRHVVADGGAVRGVGDRLLVALAAGEGDDGGEREQRQGSYHDEYPCGPEKPEFR